MQELTEECKQIRTCLSIYLCPPLEPKGSLSSNNALIMLSRMWEQKSETTTAKQATKYRSALEGPKRLRHTLAHSHSESDIDYKYDTHFVFDPKYSGNYCMYAITHKGERSLAASKCFNGVFIGSLEEDRASEVSSHDLNHTRPWT